MIHIVGPGGAGKTTTGALLAERLGVAFVDLDERFLTTIADIGSYIEEHGYLAYASRNVELYLQLAASVTGDDVVALSSGFMTYPRDAHSMYAAVRERVAASRTTLVLLPALNFECCVAEIVRRQRPRPFARSAAREEAVIRERFWWYAGLPAKKVETMRSPTDVVDEIVVALAAQLGADPTARLRIGAAERQGRQTEPEPDWDR